MSQIISIVVAVAENNAIGKNNQLLWHLPADLKHFKNITSGRTVVMGRKTYDSIGKPLPNRKNIIITRQKDLILSGADVVSSLEEALSVDKESKEIFIIGGAEIYKNALPFTNRIYLTTVHQQYEADTFFPAFDRSEWKETSHDYHPADEKNSVACTFSTLEKK